DTTFSWANSSTVTPGTNGSASSCTTNTTANFLLDPASTSGLATNLKDAIAACTTPATVGVTASTTGTPTVTVTAATAGTTADAIGLASTITGYAWAAAPQPPTTARTLPSQPLPRPKQATSRLRSMRILRFSYPLGLRPAPAAPAR